MRIYSLISAIILFAACKNSNKPKSTYSSFPVSQSISGKSLNLNDKLIDPSLISVIGDTLILIDKRNDFQIHFYDLTKEKILGHAGPRGDGKGELLSPVTISGLNKRHFWVYDLALKSFSKFALDSIIRMGISKPSAQFYIPSKLKDCYDPIMINDSTFISPFLGSGGRMKIFDLAGNVRLAGSFPSYKVEGVSDTIHAAAYQSLTSISPSRKKIALSARYADQINIYNSAGEETAHIIGPDAFIPDYRVVKLFDNNILQLSAKGKFGYIFCKATDKYIYGLYSGKSRIEAPGKANFGQFLDVFDWNGNPIKRYKLDRLIYRFELNSKEDAIYAIGLVPNSTIIEYKL